MGCSPTTRASAPAATTLLLLAALSLLVVIADTLEVVNVAEPAGRRQQQQQQQPRSEHRGEVEAREAYFDGTGRLELLSSSVSVHRHSGLNFRTCEPGTLFDQRYEGGSAIVLSVDQKGLLFTARIQQRFYEARLNARLLDNRWYSVNLVFRLGNLTLSAAGNSMVVANATYNSEILSLPEETGNGSLYVGEGFHGCILQGPGILFNHTVNINAVFGPCPLSSITGCPSSQQPIAGIDFCQNSPCRERGNCIPKADRYECQCYPRYYGQNCQHDYGTACRTSSCRNGGTCIEDERGDFSCVCPAGYGGPRCEALAGTRPCDTGPCQHEGRCIELNGDLYRCECQPGWTGRNCDVDFDECSSAPCRNGGNCTDLVNGFLCKCDHTGYKGSECEIDIDECQVNPCLNQGSCYNVYGSYVCACPPGFEGQNCEMNLNECLSGPCRNGGECIDDVGSYRCNCTGTGYAGEHCELLPRSSGGSVAAAAGPPPGLASGCELLACPPMSFCVRDPVRGPECVCRAGYTGQPPNCTLNLCASAPCKNAGVCTNLKDKYECSCPPGWKGGQCDSARSSLEHACPGECRNGGECVAGRQGPQCRCPEPWTGPRCAEPLSCGHRPCKRALECHDHPKGYHCVCEPGWTGPECSVDVDECLSEPCLNAGVCIDGLNNYYCQCRLGFSGKNCQLNVDECASAPCMHGGACLDHQNGYLCNCTEEYVGQNCEREWDACYVNPCANNGSCVLSAKSRRDFICKCAPGYEGKTCTVNVDDCIGAACPPGRLCVDGVAGYECRCPEGTQEPNCTAVVNQCASDPCVNGQCLDLGERGHKCNCNPGYTGETCAEDVNECEANGGSLCKHGICVNRPGGYNCYCVPGYSGDHCDVDVDECLPRPCRNNGTCLDRVNAFECQCPNGYTGKTCELEVDECASSPCRNGATCQDLVGRYACTCAPGFAGLNCEIDIDECAAQPCLNGGGCLDRVNGYVCNCTETGFGGEHCENNIDDCLPNPCEHGAECLDEVRGFKCLCYEGYNGPRCENDVDECESSPCQYNGTCLEHSNVRLYSKEVRDKPDFFNREFSYANASGYECKCVPGTTGKNCEVNINECESSPCQEGQCIDKIGGYVCECEEGFEGEHCDVNIDECARYTPCNHGVCVDMRADYYCNCDPLYGGKNCSVELTGCQGNVCMHNGTCWPYLVDETEHKFNCTCPNGFYGDICDRVTTMSLSGKSFVMVNSSREEGYDIQFRFRTTIPNGLLAMGKGPTLYMLRLVDGRLNLQSSLLNKWDGVFIGGDLNNSNWQKVFVAINATHLVLSANEEQTIYPINSNEAINNASHTSFPSTFVGSTYTNLRALAHGPPFFIGCIEDLIINGEWVYADSESSNIYTKDVERDCPREPQCQPNPCQNSGQCTDRWRDFSCKCERPYLGHTCQHNMTAATFGYENITDSYVTVRASDGARKSIRSVVDISMFIRSRVEHGDIFYLGSEPTVDSKPSADKTFLAGQLDAGELILKIQFNGTEAYRVSGVKLNDGNNHLIQVVRNVTLVQVKINGTEYFRKTIGSSSHLNVTVLFLGGLPRHPKESRLNETTLAATRVPQFNFKGIIQDVQISNGTGTMVVEFYPLNATDIPTLVQLGNVSFDPNKVLEGVVSDNVCEENPCHHNGTCHVTWNDFWCECPRGYTGKTCQEIEFCQLQECPAGSKCQNLEDGYECLANATFDGVHTAFNYVYYHSKYRNITSPNIDTIKITYRSKTGGTLMHISPKSTRNQHFTVSVFEDKVTVAWKLDPVNQGVLIFGKSQPDGNWTTLLIKLNNDTIEGTYETSEASEDTPLQSSSSFSYIAWYNLLVTGSITLGGIGGSLSDRHSYEIYGNDRRYDMAEREIGNSVEFERRLTATPLPLNSFTAGEAFKGCLGEVRVGAMLLHYFTYEEIYQNANFTPGEFLLLQQENGTSHDTIGCRLCFDSSCKNNGHCRDKLNSYVCDCPVGFANDDCSHNIDECIDNRCKNSLACKDGVANYTCVCKPGWEGWLCDEDINECETIGPCQHGGHCINLPGSFRCECLGKYIGDRCEYQRLITCDDQPCHNGSTCLDIRNESTGDNFTCSCPPGYVNTLCDSPYCEVTQCINGGICVHEDQEPRCDCPENFAGYYCEMRDYCKPNPCPNGRCENLIGNYTCECHSGYRGNNCSELTTTANATSNRLHQLALFIIPVIGVLIIIAAGSLIALFMMARKKRATRGTYSPSAQEFSNPRVEMDNVMKPPPEERLI